MTTTAADLRAHDGDPDGPDGGSDGLGVGSPRGQRLSPDDRALYERLYLEHSGPVFRHCANRFRVDRVVLEDAVSDAWEIAMWPSNLEKLRGMQDAPGRVHNWFVTVIGRRAFRAVTKQRNKVSYDELVDPMVDGTAVDEQSQATSRVAAQELLRRALPLLSIQQQRTGRVVLDMYERDQDQAWAARRLGIHVDAARQAIRRAISAADNGYLRRATFTVYLYDTNGNGCDQARKTVAGQPLDSDLVTAVFNHVKSCTACQAAHHRAPQLRSVLAALPLFIFPRDLHDRIMRAVGLDLTYDPDGSTPAPTVRPAAAEAVTIDPPDRRRRRGLPLLLLLSGVMAGALILGQQHQPTPAILVAPADGTISSSAPADGAADNAITAENGGAGGGATLPTGGQPVPTPHASPPGGSDTGSNGHAPATTTGQQPGHLTPAHQQPADQGTPAAPAAPAAPHLPPSDEATPTVVPGPAQPTITNITTTVIHCGLEISAHIGNAPGVVHYRINGGGEIQTPMQNAIASYRFAYVYPGPRSTGASGAYYMVSWWISATNTAGTRTTMNETNNVQGCVTPVH